jgi:hypothetical protein
LLGKYYPEIFKIKGKSTIENVVGDTKQNENPEEKIVETATLEEKLLPTATLVLEKKYQDCNHTISKTSTLPVEMANLTEDEIATNYPNWTIKNFDSNSLVLYKLEDGLCTEHFVIYDENGIAIVYRLTEDYDKILYEKTNIYTEYLSDDDKEKLEEGIYVYGVSDLNSTLENFE